MRLTTFLTAAALLSSFTVDARPAAKPESSYKRALKELSLRIKYPEFFQKRDDPQRSHEVCVDVCPAYPGIFIECNWEPGPAPGKKRAMFTTGGEMLSPENAAAFFLNGGKYTHSNGTAFVDDHFIQTGVERRSAAMKRNRVHKWVVGKLGNLIMDLGIPVYTKWKRYYADQPEYEFMLSDTHGFLMGDLAAIERALLDTPGWNEFELGEWRITRRFLELAHQLD